MVSSYSARKRFEKQAPGENSNTWGGFLNSNTIDLIDEAFGLVCVAMTTAGDMTLSTQNGATDEGRNSILVLTGAPTSSAILLKVPAVESFYFVRNKMTSANKVKIVCNGGTNGVDFSGSGSGAEQGVVVADGTNVREITRTTSAGQFASSLFVKGMIFPFYNSVGAIPTGWALCDGTNGTPNLQDRFIQGTTSVGTFDTSGGSLALTAASSGDHAHGAITGSTTLVTANIPAHSHRMFIDETVNDSLNLSTEKAVTNNDTGSDFRTAIGGLVTSEEPTLGITSWAYTCAATGHTHTITSGGGHTHTITDGRPRFHTLYYIMKT